MKHALPNLESLKAFESAARNLSFVKAANELCISKGAISYQINKLESELGTALFRRAVRQVFLTEAGQKLYQTTRKLFNDLEYALEKISHENSDSISIAVTTYVASRWLSPLITDFCEQHTDISLQFQHTVNSSAFDISNVDMAIRWGRCDGRVDATRLLEIPMPMYPVISPRLLPQLSENEGLDRFQEITLLSEDRAPDLWRVWADDHVDIEKNNRRVIPDANVRVQAAIDGQGMILADDLMQSEIRNKVLTVVSTQKLTGFGYVVLSTAGARKKPAVQTLLDWIISGR